MAQINKVLHGSVDKVCEKIKHGFSVFAKQTTLRDEWSTEADGRKCIFLVYERLSPDPSATHYALSLVLLDTGTEVRLHAATTGGSVHYFTTPYISGEGELAGVLKQTLDIWDEIIL